MHIALAETIVPTKRVMRSMLSMLQYQLFDFSPDFDLAVAAKLINILRLAEVPEVARKISYCIPNIGKR
jgi:hypothetical protein